MLSCNRDDNEAVANEEIVKLAQALCAFRMKDVAALRLASRLSLGPPGPGVANITKRLLFREKKVAQRIADERPPFERICEPFELSPLLASRVELPLGVEPALSFAASTSLADTFVSGKRQLLATKSTAV